MVFTKLGFFAVACLLAIISATTAAPLEKRIAQIISDSTTKWVAACTAAGGADRCGTTSQTAFMTLLAGAGVCDQQNAADAMIDLARDLQNDAAMVALAQVFAQQPRNSPDKLSVAYCQDPPRNAELRGLFQCQFQGVDPTTFTGNVKVGAPGTIPLGLSVPLSPTGSCKAHPQGGIADGTQLVDLTEDPGVGTSGGSGSSNSTGSPTPVHSTSTSASDGNAPKASGSSRHHGSHSCKQQHHGHSATASGDSGADAGSAQSAGAGASAGGSDGSATVSSVAAGVTPVGGFKLQNGKDAQALNSKFAGLTDASACTDGEQACVDGGFAQCVGGKFVRTECAGGTQCFALPLVNKSGTSIACTTVGDATARIAATGASGGLTG